MMRRAFTLIEVNLAMFIMAVGTLGLVSLYSLGYRENQQSNEDVECAAAAEKNLNAIVAALSSTNMTWEAWNSIGTAPSNGWGDYVGITDGRGENRNSSNSFKLTKGAANSLAREAFDAAKGDSGSQATFDDRGLACGIVVNQKGPVCSVAVRCSRRAAQLVYQPLYYTEVYFQGLKGGQ